MGAIKGIIIEGIGGFYYVKTADSVLECRAKGIFRKRGVTPLAGDTVEVEGGEEGFVVSKIEARKNSFDRPPVANVDNVFLVVSSVDPKPNLLVLDKLTAASLKRGVKPALLFTKTDIGEADELMETYRRAGFSVFDASRAEDVAAVRDVMSEGLSVFIGNSGVGKSTFLNGVAPELRLATGETSKKLGRGRHTTRAVTLYEFGNGYVADTPGFSDVDLERGERIRKEELAELFPEFAPYKDSCFFTGCSHTVEKGCAVLRALEEGKIEKSRHDSYALLYDQAKELKDWE